MNIEIRPLNEVVTAALNVVPETYSEKAALKKALTTVLRDADAMMTPETHHLWWARAREEFDGHLHKAHALEHEWAKTSRAIFGGQIDYKKYTVANA